MTPPVTTEALAEALTEFQRRNGYHRPEIEELLKEFGELVLATAEAAHQQVTAERDEARDLAYELKLAAAGGEDVPGSANLVTPEDVRRWRDEDARQLATATSELARLRAEGEGLRAALKVFAAMSAMDPPESVPLNEWLPAITGARAVLNDHTALARAATAREGQSDA